MLMYRAEKYGDAAKLTREQWAHVCLQLFSFGWDCGFNEAGEPLVNLTGAQLCGYHFEKWSKTHEQICRAAYRGGTLARWEGDSAARIAHAGEEKRA